MWHRVSLAAALAFSTIAGCSSSTAEDKAGTPLPGDCGVVVDRFKELMIVDDAVLTGPQSMNATDGRLSFRHTFGASIPPRKNISEFTLDWMNDWANTHTVNGFKTDTQPEGRADGIWIRLICPWMRRTASNECDSTCTACKARTVDLAQAPFRPIAIINRMDLRSRPDLLADSAAGESRIVYGLTDGPGDDPRSPMLAMTLVFEYALPDTLSPHEWATSWHHLSSHPTFDQAYNTELQELTERFVKPNASPRRPNGSALSRVRSNESVFNWIWQMRQFSFDAAGDLRLSTVTNTPAVDLNGSEMLHDYVVANLDAIKSDTHLLPTNFLAGSADQLLFRWEIPRVDETTRLAFARTTCNGCHAGENPAVDTAFHISPYRHGPDKLSVFVHNPGDPTQDELAKRELLLKTELCK